MAIPAAFVRSVRTPALPRARPHGWCRAGLPRAYTSLPTSRRTAAMSSPQKVRRSKVSREHDEEFAQLLAAVAARCFGGFEPELVVSIPAKPGQEDRLRDIRRAVAARTGATDAPAALAQTRVIEDYRQMTITQRLAAGGGRFAASESVSGRSVLLIDDVLTLLGGRPRPITPPEQLVHKPRCKRRQRPRHNNPRRVAHCPTPSWSNSPASESVDHHGTVAPPPPAGHQTASRSPLTGPKRPTKPSQWAR